MSMVNRCLNIAIMLTLPLLIMVGCKAQHDVVEGGDVHRDVVYQTIYRTDSIHVTDSVIVKEQGDTVYIREVRDVYRDRYKYDTLLVLQSDTVTITRTITQEIPLTRWQRWKMEIGGACLYIIIGALIFLGIRLYRKLRG